MRRLAFALTLAATTLATGVLGLAIAPAAEAQSKDEIEQLRKELRAKVRAHLRKLERELFAEIDKALAGKGGDAQKHTTKKPPVSGKQGFLGIAVRPLKPGVRELLGVPKGVGVLIDEVVPRSAAHAAGLRRTDVLISWNDARITKEADVAAQARKGRAGQVVHLGILRQGKKHVVKATLLQRGQMAHSKPTKITKPVKQPVKPTPSRGDVEKMLDDLLGKKPAGSEKPSKPTKVDPKRPWLGVSLRPLTETERTQLGLEAGVGLLIDSVVEGSPAAKGGLKTNDVLVSWNGTALKSIDQIKEGMGKAKVGQMLKLEVVRRGGKKSLEFKLGARPVEGWR